MKLADISPVVYNVAGFTSCKATPNNEAEKTAYTYRLMYIASGSCGLVLGGNSQDLRAGDLLYLLPGERYRILNLHGDFTVINIFFDFTQWRKNVSFPKTHVLGKDFDETLSGERIVFDDAAKLNFSKAFRFKTDDPSQLLKSFYGFGSHRSEYLSVLLSKLILEMLDSGGKERRAGSTAMRITDYIEDNLGSRLDNVSLSEHFGYHPNHISRMMKKLTGKRLHEYVMERRINRAQTLLTETRLPIAEIAQMLGFADSSHFSRVFREFTGVTPSGFRGS